MIWIRNDVFDYWVTLPKHAFDQSVLFGLGELCGSFIPLSHQGSRVFARDLEEPQHVRRYQLDGRSLAFHRRSGPRRSGFRSFGSLRSRAILKGDLIAMRWRRAILKGNWVVVGSWAVFKGDWVVVSRTRRHRV